MSAPFPPVALLVSGRPAPDLPVRLAPVHAAPPGAVIGSRHTTAATTVRAFAGDHFYLHHHPDVLPAVVASLRRAMGRGDRDD